MRRDFIIALILVTPLTVSSASAHRWCWTCDKDNTYGWHLMAPEERKMHQARLAGFTDYSSCKEYVETHHMMMEERAREMGADLPVIENNPCNAMKNRGVLK